jgi:Beta-lactamase superfamily domain
MKSFGQKPAGLRLDRIKNSPLWTDSGFRNQYPIAPGLRDRTAEPPTLSEFLCGGERRYPAAPRITELDWWESYRLPNADLTVTAAPSQHFSGRWIQERNTTLWSSMAIRSQRHAVFFSGDTGLTNEYATIRDCLGPFDLVMLEVGAFHASWGDMHLGPRNALKAMDLLGGGALLPVHWGTFCLAMHAWDEPAETLLAFAPAHAVQLIMPKLGQVVEPAQVNTVIPWWRSVEQLVTKATEPASVESMPKSMPWPID